MTSPTEYTVELFSYTLELIAEVEVVCSSCADEMPTLTIRLDGKLSREQIIPKNKRTYSIHMNDAINI